MNNIPELRNLNAQSKIVFLSGAGVSAESGISTFRDNGGLWEQHNIYEVATPEAWTANPDLVLEFYNQRRKQLREVKPNAAHYAIAGLQQHYQVEVITQNVDDLHERAGSDKVLHLHGELLKSQSSADPRLVYDIEGWEIKKGDLCEKGSQLRPNVVWFGEMVPMIEPAQELVAQSDLLVVVGTSLNVYPAAGLLHAVHPGTPIIAIDPASLELGSFPGALHIREKAGVGMQKLVSYLRS
jgi:NAD-dependent deacetylase